MSATTSRQLPCMIEGFLEYTSSLPSPEIFRRWAAVCMVAGAVTRRVWLKTSDTYLYPNMLCVFVAPPGVGKGMAIQEVLDLWTSCAEFNIAPSSLTRAGFEDALGERPKMVDIDGKPATLNCLLAAIPEFGTLFTAHDLEFFNKINDIYDCKRVYARRTRSGGEINIFNPYFHMLSGTQPGFLGELLPEQAFKMGFTSRLLLIYAGERITVPLFGRPSKRPDLKAALVADLKHLAGLSGGMSVESDAVSAIESWHRNPTPIPDHHRLQNYLPRRIIHALKLAIAISLCRRSDFRITLSDWLEAKEMLVFSEALMPEIFKDMTAETDSHYIGEAFNYVWKVYAARKKPVLEQNLVNFVHGLVPVQKVDYIINALFRSGQITQAQGTNFPPGCRLIVPVSRNLHGNLE